MLIDTSAWVEFLRATGSPAHRAVRSALAADLGISTCDPVSMELLAGGRSETHVRDLRRLLARTRHIPTLSTDWDDAARLHRTGRSQGVTIRKLMDCLIAVIALRNELVVLHHDADFDAIAGVVSLEVRRG